MDYALDRRLPERGRVGATPAYLVGGSQAQYGARLKVRQEPALNAAIVSLRAGQRRPSANCAGGL